MKLYYELLDTNYAGVDEYNIIRSDISIPLMEELVKEYNSMKKAQIISSDFVNFANQRYPNSTENIHVKPLVLEK